MSVAEDDKIIRMANQIAAFFHSKPKPQGVEGIAEHINKFWEKRMRAQFFALIEERGADFDPWVVDAAPLINRPR